MKAMKNEETRGAIPGSVRREEQSRGSPLVPLKSGGEGAPIFMAHGLGDTAMGLHQLATRMQVPCPIYAVQAKGLEGTEDPLERVEDMAEFHLDAIRRVQTHGPYVLVGYSLGGLVTLEMAHRLKARGENVALLVMLDSYLDRRQLTLGQRVPLEWRAAKRRVGSLMGRGSGRFTTDGKVGGAIGRSRSDQSASDRSGAGESMVRAWQRVKEAQHRALRNYRPAFYDGKVKFVRAAIPTYFPADPVPVWSRVVREIEVKSVPGTHFEMLTSQVEALALVVGRYVKESMGSE